MKYFLCVLATAYSCSTTVLHSADTELCKLTLQPSWHILQGCSKLCDGQWVLLGTIVFRTKLIEPIELSTLVFSWHGTPLKHLNASLYRTEVHEPFCAIDNHWVCDALWNNEKQQLSFKINTKKVLSAITNFHLVLTLPPSLEATIKQGYFNLESHCLPAVYQHISSSALTLQFNTIEHKIDSASSTRRT